MQTAKITAFVFSLALVTSACGDSMSSLNPTAPSSLSPDSLNVEAGGAAPAAGSMAKPPKPGNGNGNANGNGNGNGNGNVQPRSAEWSRVQFEGVIKAVGADSITVNNQLVKVLADTVIRKGDVRYQLAALKAGDRVHVTAWRMQGSSAAVEASEVKLQNPGEGEAEGEEPPPPPAPSGSVSVEAPDNAASESGNDNGVFRLTRAGNDEFMALSVTVHFSLSGAAVNGTDYDSLPVSVVFAPAQSTAELTVTPRPDSLSEGSEAVVLTLTPDASYDLGVPASATVNITDPPAPAAPTASVSTPQSTVVFDPFMGFATAGFVYTRTGDLSAPLTITVALSGSLAGEVAPQIGTSVTFPANQNSVTLGFFVMSPGNVTVTVLDGAAYDPGASPSSAITFVQ
jgi:hypothetical protein